MELTKKYLNQQLARQFKITKQYFDKRFTSIDSKFAQKFANIESKMVTKDDLKDALKAQTQKLEDYVQDVAGNILEAMDFGFRKVEDRLDVLESDMRQVKAIIGVPDTKHM